MKNTDFAVLAATVFSQKGENVDALKSFGWTIIEIGAEGKILLVPGKVDETTNL
jgi:hypothetical protein